MRRLLALLVATGCAAALLSGCVTEPPAGGSRDTRPSNDPGDAERRAKVRLELASAYFTRGQTSTALDEVKLALAARPDMPEALGLRGLIYAALGENRPAEESFQRALSLAPRDGDMRHNYGWFLCQQRRYADADREFDTALAQPQYRNGARTLLAKGVCDAREGRWADAEAALYRSFQLDPANPATSYNLADALYHRGSHERARFYIQRVNSVSEQSSAATLWLAARIERRLGNPAGAHEFGRQLRDRFPQSPEAALFEQGRFDE
ncbi:type IV pilus biogenesis/stability protein PilW [Rubrivivax gelatinosus]|uniref:Type IV pilus assembly protein PilF n=1 Tax=Rubrivivax gelatinosus TaxID=28068 RepID=A0A4R2MWP3_RUBGE|nr:type IV pilus biogenesis/stability protein PilW [Rubrivivax gelatinosus]MBK1688640.1 type IV pilus biogenesis/stability protein PilW [Rubrivivax gelatinosus]TCP04543.1 type IV pilus assembly protein PilF [Rubrivivax gelatinosus]